MAEDEYEETRKLIDERIKTYDATKLKEDLSLYLEHYQEKKIVFFIDEMSEALSQKKLIFWIWKDFRKLCLLLETEYGQ